MAPSLGRSELWDTSTGQDVMDGRPQKAEKMSHQAARAELPVTCAYEVSHRALLCFRCLISFHTSDTPPTNPKLYTKGPLWSKSYSESGRVCVLQKEGTAAWGGTHTCPRGPRRRTLGEPRTQTGSHTVPGPVSHTLVGRWTEG